MERLNYRELTGKQKDELLQLLRLRFTRREGKPSGLIWEDIQQRLDQQPRKLWSLSRMEETGGEPDVISYDSVRDEYLFFDTSAESPAGRRSLCYDPAALESRKEHKPRGSALGMAVEMGIEMLDESQYHLLQQFGTFDAKTSSWLLAPEGVRKLGGAIFGDFRYGRTFVYHNGAESYYAARGFRGVLRV
ncbi:MAG TPA: DUF4256 domain-containing protein [Bacteroidales bacterium]|nr:DUF4256 domain-containing protein [Bacteroidales bacterium]HRZ78089.1 DUF4256 domain-containing protein [Bacteroidales bacterium]